MTGLCAEDIYPKKMYKKYILFMYELKYQGLKLSLNYDMLTEHPPCFNSRSDSHSFLYTLYQYNSTDLPLTGALEICYP